MEPESSQIVEADRGNSDLDGEMKNEPVPSENETGVDRAKSAERIRELNAIDQDVTRSLRAAGEAIKALTNPASASNAGDEGQSSTLDASKRAFETHTNTYYTLVQSVAARLRRQIYALEEAGIIAPNQASMEQNAVPPPPPRPASNARLTGARTGTTAAAIAMLKQRDEPPMEITNGGLGNLDVGWLNSRSDKVGKQMEAELWAEARAKLEKMQKTNSNGAAATESEAQADDEMDVDESSS